MTIVLSIPLVFAVVIPFLLSSSISGKQSLSLLTIFCVLSSLLSLLALQGQKNSGKEEGRNHNKRAR